MGFPRALDIRILGSESKGRGKMLEGPVRVGGCVWLRVRRSQADSINCGLGDEVLPVGWALWEGFQGSPHLLPRQPLP